MSKGPTPEQQLLLAEVDLEIEVTRFLRSKVGQYLVGRAKGEMDEAVERLKKADADDAKLIRQIQHEIWRADTFEKWLTDAILGGRNAEEQLRSDEDNAHGD